MLKKNILVLLLIFSTCSFAQLKIDYSKNAISSKRYINKVVKLYQKELLLSKQQKGLFKIILQDINPIFEKELKKTTINNRKLNKIYKQYGLRVFKILSKKQFKKFKIISPQIEPYKKYRQ